MRLSILAVLFLLAAAPASTAGESEAIRLTLAWNVALDAQGHVTHLDAIANKRADRVPQIRARLEQELRGWAFVPGSVDGRPAATDTVVSATITLQPTAADSFRIVFDDVRTGGRIAKAVPPKYPAAAVRRHETGTVVLRVDYDANGKVSSAAVDPASPTNTQRLVDAALEVANPWTFEPERVAGHGVAGTQSLPVCFALFDIAHASERAAACDWNPPGKHAPIAEAESVALNPVAHLVNDVAGHAL